ncbi:hypothetical protein ABI59_03710 [Acidobacteria bacterium Mor1]|nr:hypothetical protein ABI59_03710 [Acidobacteria bacterium Mor1]
MQPTVLTIGGSDSSGGAGIQADLKAVAANGGYGASALTAVTAQNTREVLHTHQLPAEVVEAQLRALFDDLDIRAVKTGMLVSAPIVEVVAAALDREGVEHVVCDPVLGATTGSALLDAGGLEVMGRRLFPGLRLITPNAEEASRLSGVEVRNPEDAARAGKRLLEMGPRAVLVKGGHFEQGAGCDVLVTREGSRRYGASWSASPHTHGTGCSYASAIATWLARGASLEDAVGLAKQFIDDAIRAGIPVGGGAGPTDPFFFLRHDDASGWLEKVRS